MAFSASVKTAKAFSSVISGTKAQLEGMQKVVPAGIWFLETDTNKMKVSDGSSLYSAMPYKVDAIFTETYNALLANAGAANGAAVLDASGKLAMDVLPTELTSTVLSGAVKYVADIAARDTLTEKGGLIIVVDASADASVAAGTAGYSWDGSAWTKVFESESMDVSLADYFAMSVNTLDDVKDGTTYVRMAKTWKESVDSDLADVKGRLTTAEADITANKTAADTGIQEAKDAAAEADRKAVAAQGEVDALEGVVETLTQTVATNKSAAETGIGEAKAAAGTAQAAADKAQGDIDAHKQAYATDKAALEGGISTNAGKISTLEGLVAGHTEDIADINEILTTLSGGTSTSLKDITDRLDAAEGDIDDLQGRMQTAEGEIDILQANALQTTDTIYLAPMTVAELEAAIA